MSCNMVLVTLAGHCIIRTFRDKVLCLSFGAHLPLVLIPGRHSLSPTPHRVPDRPRVTLDATRDRVSGSAPTPRHDAPLRRRQGRHRWVSYGRFLPTFTWQPQVRVDAKKTSSSRTIWPFLAATIPRGWRWRVRNVRVGVEVGGGMAAAVDELRCCCRRCRRSRCWVRGRNGPRL